MNFSILCQARKAHIFLICIIILSCTPSEENLHNEATLFSKMYTANKLQLTIETDLTLLLDNRLLDGNHYQVAHIIASEGTAPILEGSIKIRPRGVTRKKLCDLPPIMIKQDTVFAAQGIGLSENIKLVSLCKDSTDYQAWVSKEYLCYRFFNVLSDHSFYVKSTKVVYKDSKNVHADIHNEGFLIEPLEELSARVGCPTLPSESSIKKIHKEKYMLLTLFQYLIGNTDWNFSRRHNVKLLNCDEQYGPTPIPYDFDFSGLVNASYASPHPMLPIDRVTDRLLQWRGDVNENFSSTVDLFVEKKDELLKLVENTGGLSESERQVIRTYMSEFYQVVSSPLDIEKEIKKARSKK